MLKKRKLAIWGGKPYRKKPFTLWPQYDKREIDALKEVVKSRNWGGFPSPNVKAKEFAQKFAKYHNAKFGICCANGTVTLEVSLKAAGILPNDEVIVPAYTWIATASAPLFVNAVPVFCDIDEETYCIDVNKIEELITKKTKAIIPVHLGLEISDMDKIMSIAKKHNLIVIEDCAHAHGGKWRGRGVGSIGDFGSFSFQTSKLMTSGEGGIILTNNEEYDEICHSLVNCGRPTEKDLYKHRLIGYNYRLTEFQAAVLIVQLERLKKQTKKREENASYLTKKLSKINGISVLKKDKRITTQPVYQYIFKFRQDEFDGITRDHFVVALEKEGVPNDGLFYEPVYKSELFTLNSKEFPAIKENKINYKDVRCPVTEKAAYKEAVWIPHQILLGDKKDMDTIIGAIVKILENVNELKEIKKEIVEKKGTSRATRHRL